MKTIWRIFADDVKLLAGSVIALLVAVSLCLVPAVVSWFGIAGNWDPQEHLDQLKIAVANSDEGYESDLMPVAVNLGDGVAKALRGNDDYDWVTADEADAVDGVESGRYYAAIVIPADFSANLMSAFSGDAERCQIAYYANPKLGSIGAIDAEDDEAKAPSKISSILADSVAQAVVDASSNMMSTADSGQMQTLAEQLSSHLGAVADTLEGAAGQADSFAGLMDATGSMTGATVSAINGLGTNGAQASGNVGADASALRQAVSALRSAVAAAQQAAGATATLGTTELNALVTNAGSLATSADGIAANAEGLASSLSSTLSGMGGTTGSMSSQVTNAHDVLKNASDRLYAAAGDVRQLRTDIVEALSAGDMFALAQLIGGGTSSLAKWLTAPVRLDERIVNPVEPYGATTLPFFTVLSLWLGAVMLACIMRTRMSQRRIDDMGGAGERQVVAGRFGIYALMALAMAAVMWLGDVLFLGVPCAEPLLLLVTCLVCALAFVAITYLLVSLFGRVGKALCVVMLVLLVVCGGHLFPVQLLGQPLSVIGSYLPFAFGMDALAECVGGLSGTNWALSMGVICAFLVASLVLALAFCTPMARLSESLKAKLSETGLV